MSCATTFWWIRIRGTVFASIWWQVVLVAHYAAAVVAVSTYVPKLQMNFPQTLIDILGLVVGLLLAFRCNNAYDRYWEGRGLWTKMTQNIRKLTRAIWIGVDDKHESKATIIKLSALNLSLAFVVALKHYIRDEYSYYYDDLKDLIKHLPKILTPSSNIPLEMQLHKDNLLKKEPKRKAYEKTTPTNIPLEISYYFRTYIKYAADNELADDWSISVMQSTLSDLVDRLADFERLLRTPIPLAYSIHLNHSVWLYILTLPYQLVGTLSWWTIPVVALGSFTLLGILSIGWEIENPFGYDDNDLPLDDFCKVMRRELDMVIGCDLIPAEEWIFSDQNCPVKLGEAAGMTAKELAALSDVQIKKILADAATLAYSSGLGPTDDSKIATELFMTTKGYQRMP